MKRKSMQKKIFFTILVLGFFFCLLVSLSLFFYLQKLLVDERVNNIEKIAKEQIHETVSAFNYYSNFVSILSTNSELAQYLADKNNDQLTSIDQTFNKLAAEDKNILSVYLIDKSGLTLISTDKSFVNKNYGFREYFKEAISGKPGIETAIGVTSKQFGYYFSQPVINSDNQVIGALVVKVSEDFVNKQLLASEIATDNTYMLTDEMGIVMASNNHDRFLTSLGPLSDAEQNKINSDNLFANYQIKSIQYSLAKDIINNYSEPQTITIQDDVDEEKERIYVEKLANFPFFLVTEISIDDVQNSVYQFTGIISLLIIFIFSVIAVFGYRLFIVFIIKPIKEFTDAAKNISLGNFSTRISIKTDDELENLAETFNTMSVKVENFYRDLNEKVKEKTADLEKFKLAVDSASDHIVITDPEGIVLYGNKAVEKITGYSIKESLGVKAGFLWRRPMTKEFYEKFWDTIKNKKKVLTSEIINKRKNGELYSAEVSITPILDHQKKNIKYFLGIERDISERKEAEDQIRKVLNDLEEKSYNLLADKAKDEALFANIGDGVLSTNQDGAIIMINDSALNMLGYTREEMLGKPVIETMKMVDAADKPVILPERPMVLALSNGEKTKTPLGKIYYYKRKDGTKFPVNITVTPFVLDGKIVGVVEVFRDVTLETDIDRMKTEFVSLASHQLRTPLSAINWYAEMLLEGDAGKLNAEQKDYLKEIYQGNQRMVDLVNSLLNVSRIELGTFAVDPEMLDIKDIIKPVLSELKPMILEKKLKITESYDKTIGKISLDSKLFRIVVQNFITNAVKYTPEKGKIIITYQKRKSDILFSFTDTGYGIPKKDQAKIFTKMFRADNVKVKDTSGTGLGLYIVRSIIEQTCQGKVWFESIENKGTTFYFTLPLKGMIKKEGSKALT